MKPPKQRDEVLYHRAWIAVLSGLVSALVLHDALKQVWLSLAVFAGFLVLGVYQLFLWQGSKLKE
jgi:hypothetical protein